MAFIQVYSNILWQYLCSTFKRLTSVWSINKRLEHKWWTNVATGDRQLAAMRLGLTYLADQVAAIQTSTSTSLAGTGMTTVTATSPASSSPSTAFSKQPLGIIIDAVVGVVGGLIIGGFAVYFCLRERKTKPIIESNTDSNSC